MLTGNHDDFVNLHYLIIKAQGHHPGILIVCRDNNPKRDLTPREIARAIRNLAAAGLTLANSVFILNHWK